MTTRKLQPRKIITKNITKNITKKNIDIFKNKSKTPIKLLIGCHASITPSVLTGLHYANSINATAVQIFLGNNRSSTLKTKTKLTPVEIAEICYYLRTHQLVLIIHSVYLLNFCKERPESRRIKYMHDNIQYDLHLGAQLNAKCVVLHLGFKNKQEPTNAIQNLIDNVIKILIDMPNNMHLALETSAGIGSQAGASLEELALIWRGIIDGCRNRGGVYRNIYKRCGFCIDTAHIFVSGYDISNLVGIKSYLAKFDDVIGIEHIMLFHINDSKYKLGERRDEHRGIGLGKLFNSRDGIESLSYITQFCNKHKIPMILETHSAGSSSDDNYAKEIKYISNLLKHNKKQKTDNSIAGGGFFGSIGKALGNSVFHIEKEKNYSEHPWGRGVELMAKSLEDTFSGANKINVLDIIFDYNNAKIKIDNEITIKTSQTEIEPKIKTPIAKRLILILFNNDPQHKEIHWLCELNYGSKTKNIVQYKQLVPFNGKFETFMFSLYEYPEPLKYIPTDTSYLDRFKEYIKFSLFLAQNQLKLIARKVFNVSFDHSLTYGIANILTNMSKSKSKSKNAYKSEKLFKHL